MKLPINSRVSIIDLITNGYEFGEQCVIFENGLPEIVEGHKYYRYVKEHEIDCKKLEGKWLATNAKNKKYMIFDSEQDAWNGLKENELLSPYKVVNCIGREYIKVAICRHRMY